MTGAGPTGYEGNLPAPSRFFKFRYFMLVGPVAQDVFFLFRAPYSFFEMSEMSMTILFILFFHVLFYFFQILSMMILLNVVSVKNNSKT